MCNIAVYVHSKKLYFHSISCTLCNESSYSSSEYECTLLHDICCTSMSQPPYLLIIRTPRFSAVPPGFPDPMRRNGALDGQPAGKRRRGRRKNVEGMDVLFMNRNQPPATSEHVSMHTPPPGSRTTALYSSEPIHPQDPARLGLASIHLLH